MKRNLKLVISSLILLFVISCTTYKYLLHNEFDGYYTDKQVDSICRIERIPYVGEQWRTTALRNEHTGQYVEQGFYIINQDTLTIVYSVTDMDSLYRFKKRISKRIKQ